AHRLGTVYGALDTSLQRESQCAPSPACGGGLGRGSLRERRRLIQARRLNWRNQIAGFALLDSLRDERPPPRPSPASAGEGASRTSRDRIALSAVIPGRERSERTRNLEIPGPR